MNNYNQVLLSKFEEGVLVIPISSIVDRPLKELLKFKEDTGYDFTSLTQTNYFVGKGVKGLVFYDTSSYVTTSKFKMYYTREATDFSSLYVDTPWLSSLLFGEGTLEIQSIGELSVRERLQLAEALNLNEAYLKEMYDKFKLTMDSLDVKNNVVCKGSISKVSAREVLKEIERVPTSTRRYEGVSLDEIKD